MGIEDCEEAESVQGVLVVGHRGPLFFANAEAFVVNLTKKVNECGLLRPISTIVLNCGHLTFIDGTSILVLQKLEKDLKGNGQRLLLAAAHRNVARDLVEQMPDQTTHIMDCVDAAVMSRRQADLTSKLKAAVFISNLHKPLLAD